MFVDVVKIMSKQKLMSSEKKLKELILLGKDLEDVRLILSPEEVIKYANHQRFACIPDIDEDFSKPQPVVRVCCVCNSEFLGLSSRKCCSRSCSAKKQWLDKTADE